MLIKLIGQNSLNFFGRAIHGAFLDHDMYGFPSPSSTSATLNLISIPSLYRQAIEQECWQQVMDAELEALEADQIWDLVVCPQAVKPVGTWK